MRQILYLVILCFVVLRGQAQTEPRLVLPVGHTDIIRSAVFSPDGKFVLTASDDNTARIWDVKTGFELQCLIGHTDFITNVAFSADGSRVLTVSPDSTARLWNSVIGHELYKFKVPTSYNSKAVYSVDSKFVAVASIDGSTHIFDAIAGQELRTLRGHTGEVNSVIYSSDTKFILTASNDKTARLWNADTGIELCTFRGHEDQVFSAVISQNGKFVLTASDDSTARLWNASNGQNIFTLKEYGSLRKVSFSPDDKFVLTSSWEGKVRIWEVETGLEIKRFLGHDEAVEAVYSPDGRYVLTASNDGTARVWDTFTDMEIHNLSVSDAAVRSATYSPDGNYILTSSSDRTARIWCSRTGVQLQLFRGQTVRVNSALFGPNGQHVLTASSDNCSRIIDVKSGSSTQRFIGHSGSVGFAIFNRNGKLVLTGSKDSTARIWDAETGQLLHILKGHEDAVISGDFSPLDNYVITSSRDKTARIWNSQTENTIITYNGHKLWVNSAVFSPDGKKVLSTSFDKETCIWDPNTGLEICSMLYDRKLWFSCDAVFSSDGKNVLTSELDSTIRLWDGLTGSELRCFRGHSDRVVSAVFSNKGNLLLSASWDGSARLWDAISGKNTLILSHKLRVKSAVFSPDDKYILTTGADHKTILWETATGKALYTRLQLEGNDWLVYDEHYRFDGTPGAIEKLYFVCGLEVIDLAQMKDSLWVPGLAEKIMTNQPILINDKPAPKLSELNICELTPVIEPIEQEDKRMLKYCITPRRGALGDTELYINGNLTYTYKPEKLEKKMEGSITVYYLTIDSDTLQGYLAGEQYTANPVLIKSKVKGTGIYGRGDQCTIAKKSSKDDSHFYGVFIGVNDYGNERKEPNEQHYKNLDFAVKDAQDLSVAVEQTARNLFKDNCHIYRLTGEGNTLPTKDNLKKVLADIGSKSKASDVLYIFFAGHGDVRRMKDTLDQVVVEQDQIRFMMQRADKRNPVTTSFGVRELSDWCSPRRIKAQKRVFVFDACHSGKITQEAAGGFRGDDEGTRIRQLDKLKDKNGMMILAAAADDESAYEDETLNQGVLTYHLLQVMKEEAKDTSLVVRDWFDETIDLVKEYSRLNGNKQEPSSFGDGRFEIGNVRDNVRDSIKITCPKTRVGACVFVAQGQAKLQFPNVKQRVNEYFASKGRGDQFVYSKNTDKAYRTEGLYLQIKDETQVTYDLYSGEELLKSGIELPLRKYTNEDELVQAVVTSITQEIEALSKQDERCKLMNK
jgi:WD40 repeat protein